MTPKFLREEAARFRSMADTTERQASKSRLLAMANDYDTQASAADGVIEPNLDEAINATVTRKAARVPRKSI